MLRIISFFLSISLAIAAVSATFENAILPPLKLQTNLQRRQLVSSLDSLATTKMQRDSLPSHGARVPHPELYYLDQDDGSRLLIWPPEETLPRDVLARRPEVWLCAFISGNLTTAATLLPSFLEHYSRLGERIPHSPLPFYW